MLPPLKLLPLIMVIMLISSIEPAFSTEESTKPGEPARPGVPPATDYDCPPSHPIKGNFTTYSGERCIYHVEGQKYYLKTKPERCYATKAEAVMDGCRGSKI